MVIIDLQKKKKKATGQQLRRAIVPIVYLRDPTTQSCVFAVRDSNVDKAIAFQTHPTHLLPVTVNLEQLVGYDLGIMNTSSDKLIMIDIISAYTKAWVDGIAAVADTSGTNSLDFMDFVGNPISPPPLPSALQQLEYNESGTNIVWSASILNVTTPALESELLQQLSGGLRGHWLSLNNPEFRFDGGFDGFILPVFQQGPITDITTRPLLTLREYYGTCKTNTCSGNYNVIVPVPTIRPRPSPIKRKK